MGNLLIITDPRIRKFYFGLYPKRENIAKSKVKKKYMIKVIVKAYRIFRLITPLMRLCEKNGRT